MGLLALCAVSLGGAHHGCVLGISRVTLGAKSADLADGAKLHLLWASWATSTRSAPRPADSTGAALGTDLLSPSEDWNADAAALMTLLRTLEPQARAAACGNVVHARVRGNGAERRTWDLAAIDSAVFVPVEDASGRAVALIGLFRYQSGDGVGGSHGAFTQAQVGRVEAIAAAMSLLVCVQSAASQERPRGTGAPPRGAVATAAPSRGAPSAAEAAAPSPTPGRPRRTRRLSDAAVALGRATVSPAWVEQSDPLWRPDASAVFGTRGEGGEGGGGVAAEAEAALVAEIADARGKFATLQHDIAARLRCRQTGGRIKIGAGVDAIGRR